VTRILFVYKKQTKTLRLTHWSHTDYFNDVNYLSGPWKW